MKYYDKILTKLIKTRTKELDDTHFSQRDYWPISLSHLEDDIISDFFKYLNVTPGIIFKELSEHYTVFLNENRMVILPKKISKARLKKFQKEMEKRVKTNLILRLTPISVGDERLDNPKFVDKFYKELNKFTKKYK